MTRSVLGPLMLLAAGVAANCASGASYAGAAVQPTERGGALVVSAPLDSIAALTRAAFSDLDIRMQEVERKRDERTFKGVKHETEVTADLKRESEATTHVEITARSGAAEWDTLFARKVLQRIVRHQH